MVTQGDRGFQLHLNGHLQFNSVDEYRYHESLVHPPMSATIGAKNVLVLGGGDGLAVREILKYESVESVTLVDIDPAVTSLALELPPLQKLSQGSLSDDRVTVVNRDAFVWISECREQFDAVVIDFPDPGSFSIGKLYTTRFFRMLSDRMTDDAVLSIQCTSPLVAPNSYWCILQTMESVGFTVLPYHVSVPTFGVWGFGLARARSQPLDRPVLAAIADLRFLNPAAMSDLFNLPADIRRVETDINQLNNQSLVRYYEREWNSPQ